MSKNLIKFIFGDKEIIIRCSEEEKMKDIIKRLSNEIKEDINSFQFLYEGNQIDLNSSFMEQANIKDKKNGKMNILLYKKENNILIKDNSNEKQQNIIKAIIDIKLKDINQNITLFNTNVKDGIDVYLNYEKINILKKKNKCYCNIKKEGKYNIDIIFKGIINNMKGFFSKCSNIISLDFSNCNFSIADDLKNLFYECINLKEIKGINKIITNKVINLSGIFEKCSEIEYIDLFNSDTSNVINMSWMFDQCNKLKEIKGLNNLITNKVKDMKGMFKKCYELEYLDLSNFDISNVKDMNFMFNKCLKLKEIKGLHKFFTNNVIIMKGMPQESKM